MTEIDYFVGGGKKYFDRREKDDRNLLEELRAKNYNIGDYLTDFNDFKQTIDVAQNIGYLTADDSPLTVLQDRDYLIDASMTGIDYLKHKNENGFFMMIESSQIDWGGHANSEEWIVAEFIEFSQLIDQVMDWAAADGETLVIVTADHETGGFTIQPGSTMDDLVTTFTTGLHSGDFIPVFAYGPGSELFSGIYENTQIYHKIRAAKGWK
jgi:alkaline phosphatase